MWVQSSAPCAEVWWTFFPLVALTRDWGQVGTKGACITSLVLRSCRICSLVEPPKHPSSVTHIHSQMVQSLNIMVPHPSFCTGTYSEWSRRLWWNLMRKGSYPTVLRYSNAAVFFAWWTVKCIYTALKNKRIGHVDFRSGSLWVWSWVFIFNPITSAVPAFLVCGNTLTAMSFGQGSHILRVKTGDESFEYDPKNSKCTTSIARL